MAQRKMLVARFVIRRLKEKRGQGKGTNCRHFFPHSGYTSETNREEDGFVCGRLMGHLHDNDCAN